MIPNRCQRIISISLIKFTQLEVVALDSISIDRLFGNIDFEF